MFIILAVTESFTKDYLCIAKLPKRQKHYKNIALKHNYNNNNNKTYI